MGPALFTVFPCSLVTPGRPFSESARNANGAGGRGFTAEKMKKCVWVRPEVVAQIEFLEWTDADHLRHSKFAGLRDDKNPRSMAKEHAGGA
jgi:ATP-dependent DNA ligase